MISRKLHNNGFTLVELLVSLMVTFILLTAVVTLAYAMNSAYKSTDDMNEKQARIRYMTLKVSDLIKYSKLVGGVFSTELVLWRNDDNNDNKINVSEIVYIDTNYTGKTIRLLQFNPSESYDMSIPLYWLQIWSFKNWLISRYNETYITLIEQCDNLSITSDTSVPYTNSINLFFDITENGISRTCQINSTLRCKSVNLIQSSSSLVSNDDD